MVEPIEPWFAFTLAALLWLAYLLPSLRLRVLRRRARLFSKDK